MISILVKIFRYSATFISAIVIFSVFTPTNVGAAILNKPTNSLGLVAHWTFDGADMVPNVRDRSGNGYHLYIGGQSTLGTSTVVGKVGQGLRFDGVDDILTSYSFNWPSGGGPITVAFWVNTNDLNDSNILFNAGDENSDRIQAHVPWYQDSLLYWDYGNHTANGRISTDFSSNLGKWTHVALVSSGNANTFKGIYLNGVLANSSGTSDGPENAYTSITIGKASTANYQEASLDDFRIYNRVLSAAEINRLYNSNPKVSTSKTPTGLQTGLIGHWTFDGADMVPNVRDKSTSANHGSLVGQISTTTVTGKLGQALKFDGTDDCVNLATTNMPTGTNARTSSLWFKLSSNVTQEFFGYGQNADSQRWGMYYGGDNTLSIEGGGASGGYRSFSWTYDTNWHQLAFVLPAGASTFSQVLMYLDGTLQAETAVNNQTINTTLGSDNAAIGAIPLTSQANDCITEMLGSLDDVRLYNTALTATEIKQLYAMGVSTMNSSKPISKGSLSSSLVGHWTFDGAKMVPNVRDSSTIGNHGNLNGQSATTTRPGKIGQALFFDGVDDVVIVPENDNLDLTGDFTIATWYKTSSVVDEFDPIYSKDSAAVVFTFGTAGFWLCKHGISCPIDNRGSYTSGSWAHVAVTRVGNTFKLYTNGAQAYTVDDSVSFTNTATNLYIGQDYPVTTRLFNGTYDDYRIYSRGLSASEIKQLYNMGR